MQHSELGTFSDHVLESYHTIGRLEVCYLGYVVHLTVHHCGQLGQEC